MDENSPCPTFLHHGAAYQSRLYSKRHKNKRFSALDLLNACVRLVDDYNCEALPDIAPDDHAKAVLPTLNVSHPQDEIFLTQVLYGCCRYKQLLEIFTAKLFSFKSPNIQCIDKTLYTILGYLVLIRLEELSFTNFRKLVLSQHPQKVLPFVQFVFNLEAIASLCKPEWIKLYDVQYVEDLIWRLASWNKVAAELSKRLEDKVVLVKPQDKYCTAFKPFNLSTTRRENTKKEEEQGEEVKIKPFKAKPPPTWKEGPTPTQKALEALCKASRENLAKFYSHPKNQPFNLHTLERPSKYAAIKEKIESIRKLETEYISLKPRPCPEPPTSQVKLTASAVLREHALYQKQLDEERAKVKAFEVDLRDDSDFKSWQEEMKARDQVREELERKLKKAAIDACDQAGADAKNAKAQENREVVKKLKEEAEKLDALKEEFFVNLELFNRLRHENIVEGQQAVKLALIKVAELKKARAREIQEETMMLASRTANERSIELAKKKEVIQQLHTLETESAQIMKKFDRDSTAGHGLLGEMSISELQERLASVKEAIKEEEYRRVRVHASKDEVCSRVQISSFLSCLNSSSIFFIMDFGSSTYCSVPPDFRKFKTFTVQKQTVNKLREKSSLVKTMRQLAYVRKLARREGKQTAAGQARCKITMADHYHSPKST